jgi:hypothetical protein
MTSEGLTDPLLACPNVLMRIIVITIVASTTTVAPKLRDKSFRMEEWNNIVALENPNYELRIKNTFTSGCR